MYISSLHIKGFRGFKDSDIDFNEGLNVVIGHNNGGKSTVIDALRLVLDQNMGRHLSSWDFYQGADLSELKQMPPVIEVSVFISAEEKEPDDSDDIALFTSYAVEVDNKLRSCLTYRYYLPASEEDTYKKDVANANDRSTLFHIIDKKFIRKYTYNIYGGPISLLHLADTKDLKKIDFQYVDALRDVEQSMFSGRDDLLRDVLSYFLDYDLRSFDDTNGKKMSKDEVDAEKAKRENEFSGNSKNLIDALLKRIDSGTKHIMQYANGTGALFNDNNIKFDGEVTEGQMLQILKLLVESHKLGYSLPVSKNGLGYNNLIYISMLLAKMQSTTNQDFMGEANVKSFPILAIEEPEAHLHPELQYRFLEFIRKNLKDGHVRQVFITTHSSSLAAKIDLNSFTCLHRDANGIITPYYPREAYKNSKDSKNYVQRYLDATRADILFAGGIIFVEGMAEQILFPSFAKRLNCYDEWTAKQIIVVSVDGRYFTHFLKLFDTNTDGTLPIKIACVTDRDPVKEEKNPKDGKKKWVACWPIEYNADSKNFEYGNHSEKIVKYYSSHPNIRYFSQDEKSKTLEYEIARCNPNNKNILVPSLMNLKELRNMIDSKTLEDALNECKDDSLKSLYSSDSVWKDNNERRTGLIASRYLESLSKGINALELAEAIERDDTFIVPKYIENAIKWVLQ